MKPGITSASSPRLLDQVREQIRYRHYSLSTEKTYLHWVRFFIRWSGRGGQIRHPRDTGHELTLNYYDFDSTPPSIHEG